MSCPVCTSEDVVDLLDVGELPILCNQLCSTKETARSVVSGRVRLEFCRSCGHVYNEAFDPTKLRYSAEYENSLHCSSMFQSYADDLVRGLVDRYDLRKKKVLELGCGQGDFLRSICAAGDNTGVGFDPSYAGGNEDPRVTIRPVSFSEIEGYLDADLVCCRHVLEHIGEPRDFLEALVAKLKPGTSVFFEVPNVLFTIRDGGVWDIIYEHCGYFSPSSLKRAFQLGGLRVNEVAEAFDGQFLVVHAVVSHASLEADPVDPGLGPLAAGFAETYHEKVDGWRVLLGDAHRDGERVVAWGAGSKGNTFLNLVGQDLSAIVDINPKKRGKFVAGTGQPILAPEDLPEISPAAVVIMNPVYRTEIAARLNELGIDSRLLVA
jgi:2-polyprenyl-3-methyl-5-hydroxy-6-metoxy-1,4-benzoquinol methylase